LFVARWAADIAETVVARSDVPKRVLSLDEADHVTAAGKPVPDWYVPSISSAVGRIAVGSGIAKGQVIVHRQNLYWGLTGDQTVIGK
jgi:hypothetical protein